MYLLVGFMEVINKIYFPYLSLESIDRYRRQATEDQNSNLLTDKLGWKTGLQICVDFISITDLLAGTDTSIPLARQNAELDRHILKKREPKTRLGFTCPVLFPKHPNQTHRSCPGISNPDWKG